MQGTPYSGCISLCPGSQKDADEVGAVGNVPGASPGKPRATRCMGRTRDPAGAPLWKEHCYPTEMTSGFPKPLFEMKQKQPWPLSRQKQISCYCCRAPNMLRAPSARLPRAARSVRGVATAPGQCSSHAGGDSEGSRSPPSACIYFPLKNKK